MKMKKKTAVFVSSNNVGVYPSNIEFGRENVYCRIVAGAALEEIQGLNVSDYDYFIIYASKDYFDEVLLLVRHLKKKIIVFYCPCNKAEREEQIANTELPCDIEFRMCECGGVEALGRLQLEFMKTGAITENSMILD